MSASGPSERLQARQATPAISLPREQDILLGDPNPTLTHSAHSLLIQRLVGFGNVLSKRQHDALLAVLSDFTRLAYRSLTGRYVYQLQTGMGKSQAIVAWIAALNLLGLTGQVRVAVVLSKVDALCNLLDELVVAGVARDLIGLQHSYPVRRDDATSDKRSRTARLSADPGAHSRPILLTTHNKVKSEGQRGTWASFGGDRDLSIWDESLLISEPSSYSLQQLEQIVKGLAQFVQKDGPFAALIRGIEQRVQRAWTTIAAGQQTTITFFDLPLVAAMDELRRSMPTIRSRGLRGAARELLEFLDGAPNELTLAQTHQGNGLISYHVTVPAELQQVAVLDASHNGRELVRLDPIIRVRFSDLGDLKRFEQVTARHIDIAGGRSSVEKDCADQSSAGRRIPRLVVEIEQRLAPSDCAIVFTHLHKDPGEPNIAEEIKRELRAAGVDVDAMVTIDGNARPRFVFLTFGDETSISEFSYCKHVLFAGLMFRNHLDIAAHMSGQVGSLALHPSPDAIRLVEQSESVHVVYQGMSRGACRVVLNGQALPMTAWLMVKGDRLREPLQSLMPGLKWEPYLSPLAARQERVTRLAEKLQAVLRATAPARVSMRSLKASLPAELRETTVRQFRAAAAIAGAQLGWVFQGRSLVRVKGAG